MAIYKNTPPIVTNGLVLALDAANPKSYVSGSVVWRDLSGNNNSGSFVSNPGYSVPGYSSANNGTISFDGSISNGRIMIPRTYPGSLSIISNITMQAWVNYKDTGYTSWMIVLDDMGAAPFTSWCMWLNNDVPASGKTIATYDNGNWLYSTTRLFPNIWNHIAISKTGSNADMYVNGRYSNTVTFTALAGGIYTPETTTGTGIGGHTDNNAYPFNGNISQVQVHNRALTATEVLQNYNATKGRFGL